MSIGTTSSLRALGRRGIFFVVLLLALGIGLAEARAPRGNAPPRSGESPRAVIPVDGDWTTSTQTSDCVTGWGDDTWELTLTETRQLTVTVEDCCCPGDYFEVYVDDQLIGTTPDLAPPWGCSSSGPLSSASFSVTLCGGTHTITVRDAGFDGHSPGDIAQEGMCPAGFTVSGSLSAPRVPDGEPARTPPAGGLQPAAEATAEVRSLQDRLDEIEPFLSVDARGFQRLDVEAARRAGVSAEALELGYRLVALENRIVEAARADKPPELAPEDFAFIEPLFLYYARGGHPCGDFSNPTKCPPRVPSGQFFSTEEGVGDHLVSLGYHQTARYAGGDGRDYTKVVPFPGCTSSEAFRNHVRVALRGGCWSYSVQGPEPNPEVLGYRGPYRAWTAYVFWWHAYFC